MSNGEHTTNKPIPCEYPDGTQWAVLSPSSSGSFPQFGAYTNETVYYHDVEQSPTTIDPIKQYISSGVQTDWSIPAIQQQFITVQATAPQFVQTWDSDYYRDNSPFTGHSPTPSAPPLNQQANYLLNSYGYFPKPYQPVLEQPQTIRHLFHNKYNRILKQLYK